MAVRFDASTDRLIRTTDLIDYNTNYTWMAWVYLVSGLSANQSLFSASQNTGTTIDAVRVDSGNDNIVVQVAGNGAVGTTTVSVGSWFHIALTRNGVADCTAWLNGNLEKTNTTNITGRGAATRMEHGAERTADANRYDGRVCAIKIWQATLTEAEIEAEMNDYCPVRLANLHAFYPVFSTAERHKDFSGNGRDWTEGGTLTNEADKPDLPWNCLPPVPDMARQVAKLAHYRI